MKEKRLAGWWSRFTLQFFLVTILPLMGLLALVAVGSVMLHHRSMRSLVGERDIQAVRLSAGALNLAVQQRMAGIEELLLLPSPEIPSVMERDLTLFDGGLAVFTPSGVPLMKSAPGLAWPFSDETRTFLAGLQPDGQATLSTPARVGGIGETYVIVAAASQTRLAAGVFYPERLVRRVLRPALETWSGSILLADRQAHLIYRDGNEKLDEAQVHGWVEMALDGDIGINYQPLGGGSENVVAFSPVSPPGWAIILAETWDDSSTPYLNASMYVPLVAIPVLFLAALGLWYTLRRLVYPLQALEQKALAMAEGDFDAINQAVGGVHEIRHLQDVMIDTAQKLRQAQASLRSYVGALTASVERERNSLARELHDDTLQMLIALNQRLQMGLLQLPENRAMQDMSVFVQDAIQHLRRTVRGLRPIYLEDLGLVAALEMLAGEVTQSAGINIHFEKSGPERRLNPDIELAVYRIAQEALSNLSRHARASQGWLRLTFEDGMVILEIRDDGCGFDAGTPVLQFARQGHYGLMGMVERAELAGGSLQVDSNPQGGTSIRLRLEQ